MVRRADGLLTGLLYLDALYAELPTGLRPTRPARKGVTSATNCGEKVSHFLVRAPYLIEGLDHSAQDQN